MRIVPVLSVVVCLGACGDPLAGIGTLGDVDVAPTDPAAAALPEAQEVAREGFFGTAASEGAAPEEAALSADAAGAETAVSEDTAQAGAGGFFRGLLKRAAEADPAAAIAADVAKSQSTAAVSDDPADAPVIIQTRPTVSASVEHAALPVGEVAPPANERTRGRGLFGGGANKKAKPRTGPDAQDVAFGTVLAFGQIARVCDAKGKSLGTKVEGTGRRGFSLYDSKKGIRDKRTFYITGFDDKCPRQFTAANALLGAPSFYEDLRFGPAGKHLPYAATDKAYDKLKSAVCRASKNKPCGNKISKLDNSTVFVSAYEFSEYNGGWKEFLVHDGTVVASAVK